MVWINGFPFELDDETVMVRDMARTFAEEKVLPLAAAIDKEHRFPTELIKPLGELGFMGAFVPSEYGGSELSYLAYIMVVEELAAACASTSIIVSAHNSLCISPILEFGTSEQKRQYLPDLASGKTLGCFALSEPGSGSDAAALICTFKKDGKDYIVNGTKNWITNGKEAGTVILFATSDTSRGSKGVSAFVHRLDLEGISRGENEDKLGIRGSSTCSLTYENVRLPAECLLAVEGAGFKIAMKTLNGGRIGVAAQAVGIARAALRDSLAYSKERKAFGKLICEHQSIQNYLADMITGIDAARYLMLGAARMKDLGLDYIRQAAMAKLFASETAVSSALKCIQIHGGYGYVTDYPAERHLRDAKITEIYEGTSEIQRQVIAGSLLKE
jgi:butyryl-CoA dehydrogenase